MKLILTVGGLAAAVMLSACSETVATQSEVASTQQAETIVVDFRRGPESVALAVAPSPAHIVERVFGTPIPQDVQLAAYVAGSFTAPGRSEFLALLTRGGPLAGQINARPSMLAVLEQGRVTAQFVPTDLVYHSIAAVFDADGDSLDDVVLSAQAYQMGQTTMRADVMSFAGGQRNTVMSLGTVYENTCDIALGDKSVRAVVIMRDAAGTLTHETLVAACRGDSSAPAPESFRAVSSPP